MLFSSSSELAKAVEDALSCRAISNKEEVNVSCSVRLCVKRASVVAVLIPVAVDDVFGPKRLSRGLRERSVEDSTADSFCGSKSTLSGIEFDLSSKWSDCVECPKEDAVRGGVSSL